MFRYAAVFDLRSIFALQEAVADNSESVAANSVEQKGDAANRPVQELVSGWGTACSSWLQRARLLLDRGSAKVLF